jgi:type I restriction enzyme S subunit
MIADLKPYSSYKPSGVPWLGKVPEHWAILPHRAVFNEVKERDHPHEQMLSVTITKGVIKQRALLEGSSKKDSSNQDKSAYKLVCPGDIAYNKMRAWQGAVGASDLRGIVSPAYVVVRLRDENNPRYFHHLFRTPAFAKEAERWSYGITSDMWSLRPEHFKMIYGCLPPPLEQAAIVRFLDHADRRIRRYIRAKQKLIALLNEQKKAIIHRAVTRGLDPNVRLKPSGVEWLGDVPEHWEVLQVGHIAAVGNGSTPSRGNMGYWADGTYPWLNSGSVNAGTITRAEQFVTETALRECHLPRVPAGSVLVAITGQGKTRGTAAVLTIEATINQHIAFIKPRNHGRTASPEYLRAFLTAAYFELRRLSDDAGSTKGALTCEDLRHFRVILPPLDEQERLVCSLMEKTSQIEGAIATTHREIDLLREYRTRLIADVVTGKLDVREAAARLPEEEEEPEPLVDAEVLAESDEDGEGADLDTAPEETEA